MIANLFDIALIVGHGVIFYLHGEKSAALLDLDIQSSDQFFDIRRAKYHGQDTFPRNFEGASAQIMPSLSFPTHPARSMAELTFCTENAYVVETQLRRRLADLVVTERQWVATMVILVWVKLMDPLQAVFQDFFLLVKMIALMIGEKTMPLL